MDSESKQKTTQAAGGGKKGEDCSFLALLVISVAFFKVAEK